MEEDLTYLVRRLEEERLAAEQAASPESRHAHEQLARRYEQALNERGITRAA